MKIITVNLPEKYLAIIKILVGEKALYPSRSELIRVAVREFLIKELESAQSFSKLPQSIPASSTIPGIDENMFVRVPETVNPESRQTEFKTYRIIKKQSSPVHVQSSK